MKKRKKLYVFFICVVLMTVIVGAVSYVVVTQKKLAEFETLLELYESDIKWDIKWEELSPEQQMNLSYVFSEHDIEMVKVMDNLGSWSDFYNYPDKAWKSYSYVKDVRALEASQIKYGPVKCEKEDRGEYVRRNDLVEMMKGKIDIDYTWIETKKDSRTETWRIRFYNDTQEQRVYIYEDGTVRLITNILERDREF